MVHQEVHTKQKKLRVSVNIRLSRLQSKSCYREDEGRYDKRSILREVTVILNVRAPKSRTPTPQGITAGCCVT